MCDCERNWFRFSCHLGSLFSLCHFARRDIATPVRPGAVQTATQAETESEVDSFYGVRVHNRVQLLFPSPVAMSDSTASDSADDLPPLRQASSTIDSDDEDASNTHILRKLNDWPRTPPQTLDDEQLAKLFDAIIRWSFPSCMIGSDWIRAASLGMAENLNSKVEDRALERALTIEPASKRWLQRCWESGDFRVIRGAGQPLS